MSRQSTKRGHKEAIVDEWRIVVGQKYQCRFNNDPEDDMVSCITKEKKPDGTWLVQYSGQQAQAIVDECNISAKNGNVFVPFESPERALKKEAREKKKARPAERVVFKDTPVVVAIENTNVVAPTQGKSTSEGPNVMAPVMSHSPFDVMKEIERQGKFQLRNNERFKELAIMKLKEPQEGWDMFELDEWLADMLTDVAEIKNCAFGSVIRPMPFTERS